MNLGGILETVQQDVTSGRDRLAKVIPSEKNHAELATDVNKPRSLIYIPFDLIEGEVLELCQSEVLEQVLSFDAGFLRS